MLKEDEDALVCDFQEYYNLDFYAVDFGRAAVLAWGLPDCSRIKKEISKSNITLEIMLLATAVDRLNFIAWTKTKDAEKNKNRPESVLKQLIGKQTETTGYKDANAFMEARAKILESING